MHGDACGLTGLGCACGEIRRDMAEGRHGVCACGDGRGHMAVATWRPRLRRGQYAPGSGDMAGATCPGLLRRLRLLQLSRLLGVHVITVT